FVTRIAEGVQRSLHPNSHTVKLETSRAFESAVQLGRAARILSQADIAIFDLTGLTPESMFLLGIRAATRRGLSVVTAQFPANRGEPEASDAAFILSPTLPYLIRDLNVIGWRREEQFRDRLDKYLKEGIARLDRLGSLYSDLGVYDAVRNLG